MIIGVDEVNFSPSLAGDCVVCALIAIKRVRGVKDSKQLAHEQRLELFGRLQESSHYAVAPASVNDINELGIYLSRNMAIETAVYHLMSKLYFKNPKPIFDRSIKIIIDGYFSEKWLKYFNITFNMPTECLVDGDEKVYEISAASIVGRVYADALFAGFGSFYPGYRLEKNHGSPDKIAYEKIRKSGPIPYHRTNYGKGWWRKILESGGPPTTRRKKE